MDQGPNEHDGRAPEPGNPRSEVTRLLDAAAGGSPDAARSLLPLVYAQLRASAELLFQDESPAQTLQPTALVHEAYLKLAGPREIPWGGRGHFYAAAGEAMRRILVDHARARRARRAREGRLKDAVPTPASPGGTISDLASLARAESETILAVDAALSRLEAEDPRAASVVRLRFFAGLSVEQTALALDISERAVARLWAFARARLHRLLREAEEGL